MLNPRLAACAVAISAALAAGCGNEKTDSKPASAPDGFSVPKAAADAGCTAKAVKGQEPQHLESQDDEREPYSTDPPSSGAHWPLWPRWGVYDKQLQDEYAVHSLEHGGVVIWYGEVDEAISATFPGLAKDEPKTIASPRKELDGIAAVAWQQILTCPQAAVDTLGADGVESLLATWIDKTGSTATDAEKNAPPSAPPASEFEQLPEQPPVPVVDSTVDS